MTHGKTKIKYKTFHYLYLYKIFIAIICLKIATNIAILVSVAEYKAKTMQSHNQTSVRNYQEDSTIVQVVDKSAFHVFTVFFE